MHNTPSYPSFEIRPSSDVAFFPCSGTLPQQSIIERRKGRRSRNNKESQEGESNTKDRKKENVFDARTLVMLPYSLG